MSAGPPSALEHVWKRDLIFSPESRDDEGRRVVVLRLGQWPPSEVEQIPKYFPILSQLFPLISQCFPESVLSKCPNISQVPLFDFFTGVFTLFELVVQEERTQVAGVVMVLDCKGFGLSHVRWAHFFIKDLQYCQHFKVCLAPGISTWTW